MTEPVEGDPAPTPEERRAAAIERARAVIDRRARKAADAAISEYHAKHHAEKGNDDGRKQPRRGADHPPGPGAGAGEAPKGTPPKVGERTGSRGRGFFFGKYTH